MKILMFGWEFPPFFAGGVGMVCYELTKQLSRQGVAVDYVMPYFPDVDKPDFLTLVDASKFVSEETLKQEGMTITKVRSLLAAYQTEEEYEQLTSQLNIKFKETSITKKTESDNTRKLYGDNIIDEVRLFANRMTFMVQNNLLGDFDVIHAHDWTTVPAAAAVKRLLKKPLVVHVHITEVNKNAGTGVHPDVYEVEKEGFYAADKIITVSNGIKETLIAHYDVPENKIEVIHNGNVAMNPPIERGDDFKQGNKVVSYLGRVTGMKGPENFVEMAAKVLNKCPNTKFVMGGTGDKLQACIDKAKALGIEEKFYFHGFYTRDDANFFYDVSDVFVLPSLMEPFGVTPLEAMCKDTPTIVTKQSGVSEVLEHCFKVDFWDLDKMASQVVSLLKYPILHKRMKTKGRVEAESLDWQMPANKCINLYGRLAHTS